MDLGLKHKYKVFTRIYLHKHTTASILQLHPINKEKHMQLSVIFGTAMAEKGIKGNVKLSKMAGISYEKTLRIMKDQPSAKLIDVVAIAKCLELEFKFIPVGE